MMKQAKPTDEDFDNIETGIAQIYVAASGPMSDELFRKTVLAWRDRIEGSIGRVVNGGKLAIRSACDPARDVLEFRPDLQAAIDLAESLRAVLR